MKVYAGGNDSKKIGDIRIKTETTTPMNTKLTTYKYEKVLI